LIREARQRAIADHQRDEAQLNLAESLFAQGQNRRAERMYRDWLNARANQPPDRQRARAIKQYALTIWRQRRFAEAEPIMRDAVAVYRRVYPADHPEMVSAVCELGVFVRDQGRMVEAESVFREALAAASSVAIDPSMQDDANHRQHMLGEATILVAHTLALQKRFNEAFPHYQASIDAYLREEPPQDWYLGEARRTFATNLIALRRFSEAQAQIAAAEQNFAEYPDQRQPVVYAAIKLYTAWQQAEPTAGREALLQKWTAELAPDYERRLLASMLPASTQPASTQPLSTRPAGR
jgi:tetratricopeptide (TPR) repeat protein